MKAQPPVPVIHPMGETNFAALEPVLGPVSVETFSGRVHVEWSPDSAVTPMGQLPFFIDFLKTAELFEPWVNESPLNYISPNAPSKRDVLGTILLSVLAGHRRYSHMTAIRCDRVNPGLLGMDKVVSEDAVRRSFMSADEMACDLWMCAHLKRCYEPLLQEPWILDVDTTIKPLYGHQSGAKKGYNPKKPGRPSHAYHSYFMANTRLCLDVDVAPGNEANAKHAQPGLWKFLDGLLRSAWPTVIRGDCAWGNESMMIECEIRELAHLFKLRQTANIKSLVGLLGSRSDWQDAGQGWEGLESEVKLTGWSRSRRVIVLRRQLRGDIALQQANDGSLFEFAGLELGRGISGYEYAVLVTTLEYGVFEIAQLYRDRGDMENNFDELKNQWGWSGYTTQDMKRCRLMARITALVYNWWTLFTRLAIPGKHAEAITSRPLLLHAIGQQVDHGRQKRVRITSMHGDRGVVEKILRALNEFLQYIKTQAEQLNWAERWRLILSRIFVKFLQGRTLRAPPLLPTMA